MLRERELPALSSTGTVPPVAPRDPGGRSMDRASTLPRAQLPPGRERRRGTSTKGCVARSRATSAVRPCWTPHNSAVAPQVRLTVTPPDLKPMELRSR
jgi:hypothetical protein